MRALALFAFCLVISIFVFDLVLIAGRLKDCGLSGYVFVRAETSIHIISRARVCVCLRTFSLACIVL